MYRSPPPQPRAPHPGVQGSLHLPKARLPSAVSPVPSAMTGNRASAVLRVVRYGCISAYHQLACLLCSIRDGAWLPAAWSSPDMGLNANITGLLLVGVWRCQCFSFKIPVLITTPLQPSWQTERPLLSMSRRATTGLLPSLLQRKISTYSEVICNSR